MLARITLRGTVIELVQIAANAVNAKLINAGRDVKLIVSEVLSYQIEGAEQTSQFKAGRWDGRSSFLDFKTGLFPAGFTIMVGQELERRGYQVQYARKTPPLPLGPEIGTHDPLGYGFSERYDYQVETVKRLLKHHRMIARVATGGGKSNIAVLAYSTIRRPTLFLTTRGVLMHQMARAYEKAGFTPGVLGDGVWKPRRGINVGMVQTIMARLKEGHPKRDLTIALLSLFDLVIGEEAHEAGGNGYYEVMQHCRNAHYRLALTATPFMREDGEANMRLQAAFGSIGIEISEKTLIDRGILAQPTFKIIDVKPPVMLRRGTSWPACYDIGIVENVERNKVITYEAVRAAQHNMQFLALVQREKHGNILRKMFTDAGLNCRFIFGKHEQEERDIALTELSNGVIDALIGSTILDVGVDVPAIGVIALAGGGKAEVGHRQRIGRGLREKKGWLGANGLPWNGCFVIDFVDSGNKHLQMHAHTRRGILLDTPGFNDRILSPGVDFPYHEIANLSKVA